MPKKLYTAGHYVGLGLHYAAAAGLVATAVVFANPVVLAASALLVGGMQYGVTRAARGFFETKLKRHEDSYEYAPELGAMTRELYQKSGLKADDFPVYDFNVDETHLVEQRIKKALGQESIKDGLYAGFAKAMATMGKTPNAAAVRLGKPVIMISTPLLKLLDSDEEKAVLAHEFAHAAAKHHAARAPLTFFTATAGLSLTVMSLGAFFAAGWVGAPLAIGAGIVAAAATVFAVKAAKGTFGETRKKADMSLKELHEQKQITGAAKLSRTAVSVSVATVFNPVYLGAFALARTVATGVKMLGARLSRHQEFQADRGAVVLGADPLALITALRKITIVSERSTKAAFGGELPKKGMLSKAWKKATATHPSLPDRMQRLAAMARAQKRSEEDITRALKAPIEVSNDHNMSLETVRAIMAR